MSAQDNGGSLWSFRQILREPFHLLKPDAAFIVKSIESNVDRVRW